MDEDGLVGLMYEGDHILMLKNMDLQREEENAEAALHEAQDQAFALVKRTLDLTNGEWNALDPEFRAPDEDWHTVVILHAFGYSLWVELVLQHPNDGNGTKLYTYHNGVRPYHRIYSNVITPDRAGIAQWLVNVQQKQQWRVLMEEAQARVFTPFAFYRVWYGYGDEDYYDVRFPSVRGSGGAYKTVDTPEREIWIPRPLVIEKITVDSPAQMPGWCKSVVVKIQGEEVRVFAPPEWASTRKTVEELLY